MAEASTPQRPLFSLLSGAQVACLVQGNRGHRGAQAEQLLQDGMGKSLGTT